MNALAKLLEEVRALLRRDVLFSHDRMKLASALERVDDEMRAEQLKPTLPAGRDVRDDLEGISRQVGCPTCASKEVDFSPRSEPDRIEFRCNFCDKVWTCIFRG